MTSVFGSGPSHYSSDLRSIVSKVAKFVLPKAAKLLGAKTIRWDRNDLLASVNAIAPNLSDQALNSFLGICRANKIIKLNTSVDALFVRGKNLRHNDFCETATDDHLESAIATFNALGYRQLVIADRKIIFSNELAQTTVEEQGSFPSVPAIDNRPIFERVLNFISTSKRVHYLSEIKAQVKMPRTHKSRVNAAFSRLVDEGKIIELVGQSYVASAFLEALVEDGTIISLIGSEAGGSKYAESARAEELVKSNLLCRVAFEGSQGYALAENRVGLLAGGQFVEIKGIQSLCLASDLPALMTSGQILRAEDEKGQAVWVAKERQAQFKEYFFNNFFNAASKHFQQADQAGKTQEPLDRDQFKSFFELGWKHAHLPASDYFWMPEILLKNSASPKEILASFLMDVPLPLIKEEEIAAAMKRIRIARQKIEMNFSSAKGQDEAQVIHSKGQHFFANSLIEVCQDTATPAAFRLLLAWRLRDLRLQSVPAVCVEEGAEIRYFYPYIAEKLGYKGIAREFREIYFELCQPEACQEIRQWIIKQLGMTYEECHAFFASRLKEIRQEIVELASVAISREPEILFEEARVKGLYSLWLKMQWKKLSIDEVQDFFGVRMGFSRDIIEALLKEDFFRSIASKIVDPKLAVEDRFNYPKKTGWSAFSVIADLFGLPQGRKHFIEVQFMDPASRFKDSFEPEANHTDYCAEKELGQQADPVVLIGSGLTPDEIFNQFLAGLKRKIVYVLDSDTRSASSDKAGRLLASMKIINTKKSADVDATIADIDCLRGRKDSFLCSGAFAAFKFDLDSDEKLTLVPVSRSSYSQNLLDRAAAGSVLVFVKGQVSSKQLSEVCSHARELRARLLACCRIKEIEPELKDRPKQLEKIALDQEYSIARSLDFANREELYQALTLGLVSNAMLEVEINKIKGKWVSIESASAPFSDLQTIKFQTPDVPGIVRAALFALSLDRLPIFALSSIPIGKISGYHLRISDTALTLGQVAVAPANVKTALEAKLKSLNIEKFSSNLPPPPKREKLLELEIFSCGNWDIIYDLANFMDQQGINFHQVVLPDTHEKQNVHGRIFLQAPIDIDNVEAILAQELAQDKYRLYNPIIRQFVF